MHILFLTDNFPPEVNAPASRTFEHCREWVKLGHQVTVITCAPNFPKGEVYKGYKNRLWQKEMLLGICVIRVGTYITANEGFLRRTLDYMSFMASSFLASLFVAHVDVVIGTSPQFFTACAGYMTGLVKRIPWIFELRDIWPESIRAVGAIKSKYLFLLLEKLEMFLYHRASAIISVTHSFKKSLIKRGVDESKISVVTNGVDLSRFIPREKDEKLISAYGLQDKFVAGYIGTHGMAHALDTILDAAKLLVVYPDCDRFRFILIGDGACKSALMARAQSEGLRNIIFIDSVSKDEVVRYWSLLDLSIIHLKKNELFTTVIPSKLFESMSMAIPVLLGVSGESAGILKSEDVGVFFEPEDANALIGALRKLAGDHTLYQNLKKNGPIAAVKFDRSELAIQMLQVVDKTVNAFSKNAY